MKERDLTEMGDGLLRNKRNLAGGHFQQSRMKNSKQERIPTFRIAEVVGIGKDLERS